MEQSLSSVGTPFSSNSPLMIEVSPSGEVLDCNRALERVCGYSRAEVQGQAVWSLLAHDSDRRRLKETWEELTSSADESASFEGPVVAKHGQPVWTSWIFNTFVEPDGKVVRIVGVGVDQTRVGLAGGVGQKDFGLWRALVENAPDMVGVFTKDLVCRYVSPAVERITGYRATELAGLKGLEFVHPDDLPKAKAALAKALQAPGTPTSVEARFRYKDGTWHPVQAVVTDLRANTFVAGVVVNGRDVSEHRRMEEEVRESGTRYRDLFQQSRDAVYVLDREGRAVDFNQAALDLFAATEEQAHRVWMSNMYVNPEDEHAFRDEMKTHGFVKDWEVRLRRFDGSEMVCLNTATVWQDDEGRILGYQGIIRDITRQKQLEESLEEEVRNRTQELTAIAERLKVEVEQRRRAESMYRSLLDATGASIVRVNREGKRTFVSEQSAAFSGRSEDDLLRGVFADSIVPDEREKTRSLLRETFRTGNSVHGLVTRQRIRSSECYVLSNWEPIADSSGAVLEVQITSLDITELVRKETELSRRLEAEKLVAAISGSFVNSTDEDLDRRIESALERLGGFAAADRCYVFLLSEGGTRASNTHEWCADGIRSEMQNLQDLPVETVPWWMRKLNRFEEIIVPRVLELPEEARAERRILQAQDIKSVFVIPMVVKGCVIGFIGLDAVRQEREWPEEDVRPLRVAAGILAQAIERKRATEALQRSEELYRSLVEATGGGVERIGRDYTRLFVSEHTAKVVGRDRYEFIRGKFGDGLVPVDRGRVRHAVDTVFQTGKAALGIVVKTMTGRSILANLAPIKDRRGRTVEVQVTSFDATELVNAQEALRTRTRELSTLFRISSILASSGSFEQKAEQVVELVARSVEADRLCFRVPDGGKQSLRLLTALGTSVAEVPPRQRIDPGQGLEGLAYQKGEDVIVPAYASHPRARRKLISAGIQCAAGIPIMSGERVVATMAMNWRDPDALTTDRVGLLKAISGQIGASLENARLVDALSQAMEVYRSLVEATGSAVIRVDRKGRRVFANSLAAQWCGETLEEFLKGRFGDRAVPVDRRRANTALRKVFRTGESVRGFVTRQLLRDGERVLSSNVEPIRGPQGQVKEVQITSYDITESRRAEKAARQAKTLQVLSRKLVQVQEAERKAIARELHDEIGQGLTALRLTLERVEKSPSTPDSAALSGMAKIVKQMMGQVRHVSSDLRPPMLDDLGLAPTLKWHFDRFSERTDVKVNVDTSRLDGRFDPEVELAAYRIVQESLANVAKHARVSEATVSISIQDAILHIQVEDKGKGFQSASYQETGEHSGVTGMLERAASVGGTLQVSSRPGRGTRVIAQLPIYHAGDPDGSDKWGVI